MTNQAIPLREQPTSMPLLANSPLQSRLFSGLLAGMIAGIMYGVLVPPQPNWALHLVMSTLLGIVFGGLIGDKVRTAGAGLIWGEAFGLLWWFVGSLTIIPLLRGQGLLWSTNSVRELVPQLLGQIAAYGAVLGYSYYWLVSWLGTMGQRISNTGQAISDTLEKPRRQQPMAHTIVPAWVRALIVGGLGGLLGSWVFVWGVVGTDFYVVVAGIVRSDSLTVGRLLHYGIGLLIGCSFGLLFDHEDQDPGNGLIYGINYGLFWWIIGPMVLLPWLLGRDAQPYWTLATIQNFVPSFVGHILYGALVGWFYGVVNQLWRVLFVDSDPLNRTVEGVGSRWLRAILMGEAGGIIGGLLFTIVMVGDGALPRVGSLIGMSSPVAGFIVHLVISVLIGTSYGLLFYRKVSSYAAEITLGLIYGWFWWVLGAVTLFALLLKQPVDWSLVAVTSLYPSLIGHLLYGIGLAIFYQFLARRYAINSAVRLRHSEEQSKRREKLLMREQAMPAVSLTILMLGIALPLLIALK